MKHILIILAILMIAVCAWAKPYNVLVVHSYQQEFPPTKQQHEGFIDGLRNQHPEKQFNVFTEYLNAKTSHSYVENTEIIDKYIQSKYLQNVPDLIYATNDEAAAYISKTSLDYLKGVPLVLSGITESPNISRPGPAANLVTYHDIKKIVDTINSIFKEIPQIHLIGSDSKASWNICIDIERYMKKTGSKQTVETHIYKDIDNLLQDVPKGPSHVYIIANAGGFYSEGRHETLDGALRKLANGLQSRRILTMNQMFIKYGILGGFVTSNSSIGKQAGGIAFKILTDPEYKQSNSFADNHYIFDIQALEKAGIKLPEDIQGKTTFINTPKTFIEKYGNTLIWVTIILVILILVTAVSISIYIHNQHIVLRETSTQLADMSRKNQQYMDAIDASNLISVADTNGRVKYISDTYLQATGYTREEIIGKDHRI